MTQTSIGSGPGRGGSNENHDNDPRSKTLGENENAPPREPPAGADALEQAAPDLPAGVPGSAAKPGIKKGPESFPDGPNVENSPWEPDAARGNPPRT